MPEALAVSQYIHQKLLRTQLQDRLSAFISRRINDASLRSAAVAIVVTATAENASLPGILLTRRLAGLNKHSGQYALPGGKLDPGEDSITAALRELDEELGLRLTPADVLGVLDDYPTRSRFRITPVVLWADQVQELTLAPDEVAGVFHIPFSELNSDAIPVFEDGIDSDRPVLCSEFPTLGHRMYSPTASMIYQFREVAIRGIHTRVAHFDQPKFAWK